jgi:hypothetical protein
LNHCRPGKNDVFFVVGKKSLKIPKGQSESAYEQEYGI